MTCEGNAGIIHIYMAVVGEVQGQSER